jgi:ectoine hydroxylase-related dioxygenase (phytanoyl-CoA dioxygenase family)
VPLDEFTADNGVTTLIPGSHLWGDDRDPIRQEMIPAIIPAGSMRYLES